MFALTPRLTLRPGWPEDAARVSEAIGHEAVIRHLACTPWPYKSAHAEAFLALPQDPREPHFMIVERSGAHRLIGGIGIVTDAPDRHELGYWLTPEVWGRGYATEAARAVIAIARHTLRLPRLVSRRPVDNPGSARVLDKLGFRDTGDGPDTIVDLTLDLRGAMDGTFPVAA